MIVARRTMQAQMPIGSPIVLPLSSPAAEASAWLPLGMAPVVIVVDSIVVVVKKVVLVVVEVVVLVVVEVEVLVVVGMEVLVEVGVEVLVEVEVEVLVVVGAVAASSSSGPHLQMWSDVLAS